MPFNKRSLKLVMLSFVLSFLILLTGISIEKEAFAETNTQNMTTDIGDSDSTSGPPFHSGPYGPQSYEVVMDGKRYSGRYEFIQYALGNPGDLVFHDIAANSQRKSVVINFDTGYNGSLAIELSTSLINALSISPLGNGSNTGNGTSLIIMEDGRKVDTYDELIGQNYEKRIFYNFGTANKTDYRYLEVNFTAGTRQIEIMGTEMAPEVGSLSSIILPISIASIVGVIVAAIIIRSKRNKRVIT